MQRSTTAFLVVAAALSMLVSAACSGVFSFTFTQESNKQTVEGGNPVENLVNSFSPFNFEINLDRQLEKRDADGAKEVNLQNLRLVVTNTDEHEEGEPNFDFLDSITFYANSENQDRKKLAWREQVPEGKQKLSFEVDSSINLKPYIKDGMTLETEAEGNRPEQDTTIKGVMTLEVRAL
jgi:hypothetical protein